MNRIWGLLGLLLFWGCGTQQPTTAPSTPVPQGPEGVKGKIVMGGDGGTVSGFSAVKEVEQIMNYLASDELEGRDSGSKGIEKAAQFIENHFTSSGVVPYFETYRDTLAHVKPISYNIVGWVPGNDPQLKEEYILIGAHYDHIGIVAAVYSDAIANGANDNASGTATVLELARYFGKNRTNRRSLVFALFSAEERGLLGSKHLAKKLKQQQLNLYTMLNFEMTGVPMAHESYLLYITGYQLSNLAEVSNAYAQEKLIGYLPASKTYQLFKRSDNYPFHKEFGVPSHTYCSFDFTNYEYYHKPGDEVGELDLDYMTKVINKMIPVVVGISNAPEQEVEMN
ncbi:MAG: M28 family peptidase [Bacteroidota bacterium]